MRLYEFEIELYEFEIEILKLKIELAVPHADMRLYEFEKYTH